MYVTIEGAEDMHTDIFWPQVRICLALAFLEKCLNFSDLDALIVITIKHLKDTHDCLIGHLILLEGFDSMRELIHVECVVCLRGSHVVLEPFVDARESCPELLLDQS